MYNNELTIGKFTNNKTTNCLWRVGPNKTDEGHEPTSGEGKGSLNGVRKSNIKFSLNPKS